MKNTFFSVDKLEKQCGVGYAILGYASTHNEGDLRWTLDIVNIDAKNEDLYHATCSLPQRTGSSLYFTYEVLSKEDPPYRYTLVNKTLGSVG